MVQDEQIIQERKKMMKRYGPWRLLLLSLFWCSEALKHIRATGGSRSVWFYRTTYTIHVAQQRVSQQTASDPDLLRYS